MCLSAPSGVTAHVGNMVTGARLLATFRHSLPPGALVVLGIGASQLAEGLISRKAGPIEGQQTSSFTTTAAAPKQAASHPSSDQRNSPAGNSTSSCKEAGGSIGNDAPKTQQGLDELDPIWRRFLQKLEEVKGSVNKDWLEGLDVGNISDYIVPDWARQLPLRAQKLRRELSMAPGSLADDIWKESGDYRMNPEILQEARVRVGDSLCEEELQFRRKRRRRVRKALASYLNIKEGDIHPDDVPIIAMCGSGGGLRALVAGSGSFLAAKEAGLWDCVTYTAGVSGSCWLQALYHSSLAQGSFEGLINHLKNRLGVHLAFPPKALSLLTTAPTNKYLLRGVVEKLKGDPNAEFGLVDIYGILLAARLLVPRGELGVCEDDLKLSNQRFHLQTGAHPLPLYAAVRHEIPTVERQDHQQVSEPRPVTKEFEEESMKEAWFQWYEFSPYEFFCEELSSGIPTWAVGRHFKDGKSLAAPGQYPLPEVRLPGLLGIWGSAFCATLSHYYKELRPLLKGIAGFKGIDALIEGRTKDLIRVHPIDPAGIPNYAIGMRDKLPASCPESIFRDEYLRLMDAGMSNNLPIYPLLRPGRDVDIIVTFDASADIKRENWLSVVDGYARQRGIKGWPIGAGWRDEEEEDHKRESEETKNALQEAQNISISELDEKITSAQQKNSPHPNNHDHNNVKDLTYCNVWVGTTQERISKNEPPPSKRLFHPQNADPKESEFRLMRPDAGIALVYLPLLPNPSAPDLASSSSSSSHGRPHPRSPSESGSDQAPHPGSIDPDVDDFLSTWNFVYTPEQIDAVVGLAKANFAQGEEKMKDVVRAVYERKRFDRLRKEREDLIRMLI